MQLVPPANISVLHYLGCWPLTYGLMAMQVHSKLKWAIQIWHHIVTKSMNGGSRLSCIRVFYYKDKTVVGSSYFNNGNPNVMLFLYWDDPCQLYSVEFLSKLFYIHHYLFDICEPVRYLLTHFTPRNHANVLFLSYNNYRTGITSEPMFTKWSNNISLTFGLCRNPSLSFS